MKTCTTCKETKDKSLFHRDKTRKDGLNPRCKACRKKDWKAYLETERGREVLHKAHARYRCSTKGKESRIRYNQSEKGKLTHWRYEERQRQSKKYKAQTAVSNAVRDKKIPPASNCQCAMNDGTCEGRMEYHHHSYSKKHWLDVIPLCRKHHVIAHGISYNEV